MRDVFCRSLLHAASRPEFVFLTGDLGFRALEPLRDAMGQRFLNAGVAEQNMVSVAAGLARAGLRPWVYSIAPFVYARAFEQIRNDVCFHRLPVVLVGNGGGYGYGVMGATHHALEDYGALLCLPFLRAFLPAFDGDVAAIVERLFAVDGPAYLRLGVTELPKDAVPPPYAAWRQLQEGGRGDVLIGAGSIVGSYWSQFRDLPWHRQPSIWLVSELPLTELPELFLNEVSQASEVTVVEEHVAQGGLGQILAAALLERGIRPARYQCRCARGYPSGRYGSQKYHRQDSGLDAESFFETIHADA